MATFLPEINTSAFVPGKGHISTGDTTQRVTVGGSPARRFVDIIEYATFTRVRRTFSGPDGEFRTPGLDPAKEYDVICRENRHARIYQDTIRAGIYPIEP
jgi:hypothetical protein